MKLMPYRLTTEFGEEVQVDFPLHEQTESAVRVAQLLTAVLGTVDRELKLYGDVGNGDLLQALAMALALRARVVPVPFDVSREVCAELTQSALAAVAQSAFYPIAGTA